MVNHPPPKPKIPTLIGWDFFALSASVGAVPARCLVSAAPPNDAVSEYFSPLCCRFSLLGS